MYIDLDFFDDDLQEEWEKRYSIFFFEKMDEFKYFAMIFSLEKYEFNTIPTGIKMWRKKNFLRTCTQFLVLLIYHSFQQIEQYSFRL